MKSSYLFKIIGVLVVFGMLAVFSQAFAQDDEEGGGTIIFTKPVKAVIFEHKVHLAQGLDCDSCHDDPFEMAAGTAEQKPDFNMKSLYEGKYCGMCHDGETAFASNTRCTTCHIGVKGYNRLTGPKAEGTGHEGE